MTHAGAFYPQPNWERRISEIGSGYSVLTPNTAPEAPNKNANTRGPRNLLEVAQTGWSKGQVWPTPLVKGEWSNAGNIMILRRRVEDGTVTLEEAEAMAGSTLTPKRMGPWFPTPVDPSKGGGSSRSGDRRDETPTLQGMARKGLWPTPRETDSRRLERGPNADGGPSLTEAVRTYPTPTVNDSKNNGGPSQMERNTPNLNAALGGQLNPPWVEWLMGWPLGWTELQPMPRATWLAWLAAFRIA